MSRRGLSRPTATDVTIRLDKAAIEQALPLVSVGLKKSCQIQADLLTTDVARDRAFQTRFNGFYRIRRNTEWQSAFYALLQRQKSEPQSFEGVLSALHVATGRVEASFASKLVASITRDQPVIDAFVLKNLGLRLSPVGSAQLRRARVVAAHDRIGRIFADYLATELGRHLIMRFEECYPDRHLTPVKMLDLILWQAR